MIQTMQASKAVDMAFQQIAATHPEVVQALAQIQQQFHGIVASLIQGAAAQQQGQPPMIMPPEMQGQMGPSAGQQMGPGL